jgi:hypothetical protein
MKNLRNSLLAEAWRLALSLNGSEDKDLLEIRRSRLRELRQELKAFAHPIRRDRLSPQSIPLTVRQSFVKAAILLTRYHQVGGSQWRGTLQSPTLSQYCPDPIPSFLRSPDVIPTLCNQFELPVEFEAELQQILQSVDQRIEQQRRIMKGVWGESPETAAPQPPNSGGLPDQSPPELGDLGGGSPGSIYPNSSTLLSLFHSLFGSIPIPPQALDCIYTDMQVYFCLDMSMLDSNADLQDFLATLGKFSFAQFQRFPIFGACDPKNIDPEWGDRLSQQVALPKSQVLDTLSRSVAIIPTAKAEEFLLHDIWGHHWQGLLTSFEADYSILANCSEPLRAGETAYTADGPLSCGELFEVVEGEVRLDEGRSRLFFQAEVRQRLGLLFTHLLGELLADVAEFKFIWDHPQSADQLLSSSIFKSEPTKLDLSLADLDFLFLRVLQPLLEMKLSVTAETGLEMDLWERWAEDRVTQSLALRVELKGAIARLYQIFLEEYEAAYLPQITDNFFTQIVSNLLDLQNAISDLYTDITAYSSLPFQDLLILFVGNAVSGDSYAEFWSVDEAGLGSAIAEYFLPCWYLLSDEG